MLQIRLSTVSAGDGGGGAAKPSLPVDTVMVACPDHLILADLPVAKGIGSITSAAASTIKSVGRRSRRNLGERVHFCVRCDFPIAIYGRLIPCEHAFCLACARSDSSCYLCDERIQKIQTIKMMEGIFICAAPHCLKSFLKKSEFESHVHEIHADLLQPNAEREGGYETDAFNITRPSSTDPHKQSVQPESSTARAPPRSGFSPNSNPQLQDRDDRTRRHQSREPTPKPQLQPKPPQFHSHHQHQPGDPQPENHPPQGFDRPYNWFHNPQSFDNQGGSYYRRDADQFPPDRQAGMAPESSFSDYPPQFHQPPNYQVPVNANQALNPPPSFTFPPLPAEGSQPYFNAPYETPRPELVQESGSEQGSVLGLPQVGVASFPDSYPRPWGMGFMGVPFQPIPVGQGFPEVYPNPTDFQGMVPFFQGDYSRLPEGLALNPLVGKESEVQGGSADHNDGKGVLAPIPVLLPVPMSLPPPPPPPLLPPLSQQLKRDNFSSSGDMSREGQGYGWQNDQRGFGNVLD